MKDKLKNRKQRKLNVIVKGIIILMFSVVGILTFRTLKVDLQTGEVTLPIFGGSEKQIADTSVGWNLICVNRNHYIPDNYHVELLEL